MAAEDQLTFDADLLSGSFVQLPVMLARSGSVSPNAVKLYCILLSYAIDKAVVWPGQDTLCEQMGVSERSLRTTVGELKTLGLVTTQRGGDGKTMRYHVRKPESRTESRAAKTAPSETSERYSERQNTQPVKPGETVQTGKKRPSRAAKNDGSYKEEVYKAEIDKAAMPAAAVATPVQETQDAPVNAPFAAVAASHANSDSRRESSGVETKPSQVVTDTLPGPDALLVDYNEDAIDRLRKTDPRELVRLFREQNPVFAERMKKKAATAHTSPIPLLARCIVEDWLPEARTLRDVAASPPNEKKPFVSTIHNDPGLAAFAKRFAHLYEQAPTPSGVAQ